MKDKIIGGIVVFFAVVGLAYSISTIAEVTAPKLGLKSSPIVVRDSIITSRRMQLEDCIRELDAYEQYYISTETLLDSIGIDVDSPCLETDYGSNYLRDKWTLDSVYNSNHPQPWHKHL